jgi:hypothetical protein
MSIPTNCSDPGPNAYNEELVGDCLTSLVEENDDAADRATLLTSKGALSRREALLHVRRGLGTPP